MSKQETTIEKINRIELTPIYSNVNCQDSVLEYKLNILYENQEKILKAIKLLANEKE